MSALPLPPEIARVANEGLRIHPGIWRRRVVELWGDLMASDHPRATKRRIALLTYADAIYERAKRGRVRSERWSVAPAYRCTPLDPLLHSIGRRLKTSTGRSLRDAIIPADGCVLIDLDFRSSHPWFIAGLTRDERLMADLEAGRVYPAVMETLGVSRDSAKILVLALTNGGGRPAVMDELQCSEERAGQVLDQIGGLFPGLARMPRERSWKTPALQRPVKLPEDAPEHAAVGWRLQSAEADAIILSLRELQHLRVVMEVHDQLLIEAPIERAEAVMLEARAVMNHALRCVAGLPPGSAEATVDARIVPSWSGAVPDLTTADPGGPLELPTGPVPDGPWCAREAMQRVLDEQALLVDLHASPWLPYLANHEDLLGRLTPKGTADRVRTASKAAGKASEASARRDRREVQSRQEKGSSTAGGAVSGKRGGKEGDDIRSAVGAPTDWPTYTIPLCWEVGEDGSIRRIVKDDDGQALSKCVSHEPWYVLRTLREFDSGRAHVEVGYFHRNRWRKMTVPREVLRSTTKVVELAASGLDVRSTQNKNAVDWAAECEPRTGQPALVTTRTGWHDGEYIQGPGGAIELEDPRQERSGWVAKGTWGGWLQAVRAVAKEPVAALILAAAAVGPLLPWLDLGFCPVVDISGPHCTGKTTALRVAGSGWGCPDEGSGNTIRTWDSTLTGVERTAAGIWHAPLLLDETGRIGKIEQLRSAIYALVQGRGKIRGTPGSLLPTVTWENIIISSGESPIVSYTEAGGARGRPLSITTTPAVSCLAVAQEMEKGLSENYGHLALKLAEEAAKLGPELRDQHRQFLVGWHGTVTGGDTRMLSTAAAIEVAANLLISMGIPLGQWRVELGKAVTGSAGLADQAGRALEIVREELARNGARYHGREVRTRYGEEMPPHAGYRGVWRNGNLWVGIFPEVLREVLLAAKHDPEPVLVKWEKDGTLLPGTKNRKRQVNIGGERLTVYAFSREKLWATGDGEDLV